MPRLRSSPANRPPSLDEGKRAIRWVAEQVPRQTPIGLPLSATDPDGDNLSYSLFGADAGYFLVDSATGQLRSWLTLDLEIKPVYQLIVTVQDRRGGSDSIESNREVVRRRRGARNFSVHPGRGPVTA